MKLVFTYFNGVTILLQQNRAPSFSGLKIYIEWCTRKCDCYVSAPSITCHYKKMGVKTTRSWHWNVQIDKCCSKHVFSVISDIHGEFCHLLVNILTCFTAWTRKKGFYWDLKLLYLPCHRKQTWTFISHVHHSVRKLTHRLNFQYVVVIFTLQFFKISLPLGWYEFTGFGVVIIGE